MRHATLSSRNPRSLLAALLLCGLCAATAQTGCHSASPPPTPPPGGPALSALALSQASASLPKGLTAQIIATGTYSDGTSMDVSTMVTWTSSDATIASVNTGVVTALAPGSATITATLSGQSASAAITVGPAALASLAIHQPAAPLAAGLSAQLTVTGTYTDQSTADVSGTVTWSTSDGNIATVDSTGMVMARAAGSATITAALDGKTASVTLTISAPDLVSIDVAGPFAALPLGLVEVFTATGTYSDGTTQDLTTQVSWTTGDPTVATAAANVVSGVAAGMTQVSATLNGVTGQAQLNVTSAMLVSLTLMPNPITLNVGDTQQFTATGQFDDNSTLDLTSQVSWTSDDPTIASVDSAGLATAVASGTTNVNAAVLNQSASSPVTVN